MKDKTLKPYQIATILLPILFIIFFLLKENIISLVEMLPPCPFYERLHLFCPACGNTRSVKALLHGDVLTSVHYNITPIILGIFALLAYIQMAARSFGKSIQLLPTKISFYMVLIALWFVYVTIRNFVPNMIP